LTDGPPEVENPGVPNVFGGDRVAETTACRPRPTETWVVVFKRVIDAEKAAFTLIEAV
jgi:hypothetical protein